jgi:hypothetical protein
MYFLEMAEENNTDIPLLSPEENEQAIHSASLLEGIFLAGSMVRSWEANRRCLDLWLSFFVLVGMLVVGEQQGQKGLCACAVRVTRRRRTRAAAPWFPFSLVFALNAAARWP